MKRFSRNKRLQSFILAAMLSMTLLGGSVVTSLAHEGTDDTTGNVVEATTSDNTTGKSSETDNDAPSDDTSAPIPESTTSPTNMEESDEKQPDADPSLVDDSTSNKSNEDNTSEESIKEEKKSLTFIIIQIS